MLERLEEAAIQAKSDFAGIKTVIVSSGVEVPTGTPTSKYAEKVEEVYTAGKKEGYTEGVTAGIEAGEQAERDAFWDAYQNKGERGYYAYSFSSTGWTDALYAPRYSMKPYNASGMYAYNSAITDIYAPLDARGLTLDLSTSTDFNNFIYGANKIETLRRVDCSYANRLYSCFNRATSLRTIEALVVKSHIVFSLTFDECTSLENLTIEGVIGTNGFNVQWSTLLTHDSLMSIINALQDKSADASGTDWVITIGETNRAKLTEDEINIAEVKGWEVK